MAARRLSLGIWSLSRKIALSARIPMVSVFASSGFFSLASAEGSVMLTPFWSMGVTTMKMIRSTRHTSTSGVTLMSDLTSPAEPLPTCMGPYPLPPDRDVLLLDEVVHQLGGRVVHFKDEVVHSAGEDVEDPDRRDRDEESEGGRDQRLGDPRGDRSQTAGSTGGHRLEGVDDAVDRSEKTDERRRRPDGGQARDPLLEIRGDHDRLAVHGAPHGVQEQPALDAIVRFGLHLLQPGRDDSGK